MSRAAPCAGCIAGRHDLHVRDWNIHAGLIGGEFCACAGGCDQEFDARVSAATEVFLAALTPDNDPDETS